LEKEAIDYFFKIQNGLNIYDEKKIGTKKN